MQVYVFSPPNASAPSEKHLSERCDRDLETRSGSRAGSRVGASVPLPCIEAQRRKKSGDAYEFVMLYRMKAKRTEIVNLKQGQRKRVGGGLREKCQGMTKGVRRRLAQVLMSLDAERVAECAVVALTFNPVVFEGMEIEQAWDLATRKLHAWTQLLRLNGWEWLWVKEAQKNGNPHFHLMVFKVPPDSIDGPFRDWVKKTWSRTVGAESRTSCTRCKGSGSYLLKYQQKGSQQWHGGRVWGTSQGLKNLFAAVTVQLLDRAAALAAWRALRKLVKWHRCPQVVKSNVSVSTWCADSLVKWLRKAYTLPDSHLLPAPT